MMFVGFNALMLMFSNPAEFGNRQHTQYKLIILPFYQMNNLLLTEYIENADIFVLLTSMPWAAPSWSKKSRRPPRGHLAPNPGS